MPTEPGSTSSSLLDRVRARDPNAWGGLVRIYGPLVFRWCRSKGLQSEDAADVMQDVFQAVALRVADFRRDRPGDSFRGWLWTITQTKLADHFRRHGKEPDAIGGTDAQHRMAQVQEPRPSERLEPDDRAGQFCLASERGVILHAALDLVRSEFEQRTWQAFWQAAVDGRAPVDIAADLGISVNAVYKAKSRVLRRMREELADFET